MARTKSFPRFLVLAAVVAGVGCNNASGNEVRSAASPTTAVATSGPPATTTTVAAVTTTVARPTTTKRVTTTAPAATVPEPVEEPVAAAAPVPRVVADQAWVPFATVGGVTLRHPSSRVERVGFHQANHDGARQLEPVATAVAPTTLESRERGTGSRSAADVVSDPAVEVRAPVTGTVLRAGTYILYCDNSDDYVAIEPDEHPGWEVRILHIHGVAVSPGDRVIAGQTVIAGRPTQLPFESQVDEVSPTKPAWPHVHIEVVDPSIPDIPNPGGGNC